MEMEIVISLAQLIITAGSGLIGVGLGIGMFRGSVNRMRDDLSKVQTRQAKLRGEDNGQKPVFMSRLDCGEIRANCIAGTKDDMNKMIADLIEHTKSIKALDNFARWSMQKEGLRFEEINTILNAK